MLDASSSVCSSGQRRYEFPLRGQPNRCRNRHRLSKTLRISGPLLLAERTREAAIGTSLSRREIEVLEHVARGETSKEIAAALGIRERTVNWHIAQAFARLGAGSRSEAVALAMERGIVRGPRDSQTTP
ncbi:MAG: response regulator transcription factor [Candidatus Limnocylindria bacterium]